MEIQKQPDTSAAVIAVSFADAAKITGLSRSTLYNYTKAKRLPLRKVGGRSLLLVEDLRRLSVDEAA